MMADTSFSFLFQRRTWVSTILLAAGFCGAAGGQSIATVQVEENLRAEPRGVILGRISVGTSFRVTETRDQWVQIEVLGWMWTRSLQTTDRLGFDLAVSAAPRENLRAEPSGTVLARLVEGTLLERLEDVPGWTKVRRLTWIWAASVSVSEAEAGSGERPPPGPAPGDPTERWWRPGPPGAPLLSGPDGDTLARALPGVDLQILARDGNWVRVRVDAWAWAPPGEPSDSVTTAPTLDATPEQVAGEPEAYLGRIVVWELQFVSLETADRTRTDFYAGEPFLLTRSLSSGSMFVYVAVPPERVQEVEGLIPLERIRIVGRIRAGAAAFTGNPILDLVEITRIPRN